MILGPQEARRRLARLQAADPLVLIAARTVVRAVRAASLGAASVPHLLLGALP